MTHLTTLRDSPLKTTQSSDLLKHSEGSVYRATSGGGGQSSQISEVIEVESGADSQSTTTPRGRSTLSSLNIVNTEHRKHQRAEQLFP